MANLNQEQTEKFNAAVDYIRCTKIIDVREMSRPMYQVLRHSARLISLVGVEYVNPKLQNRVLALQFCKNCADAQSAKLAEKVFKNRCRISRLNGGGIIALFEL